MRHKWYQERKPLEQEPVQFLLGGGDSGIILLIC